MYLATAGRKSATVDERAFALLSYLTHVLHPCSADLLAELAYSSASSFDVEDMARLVEAATVAGSDRPYQVDVSLASIAVQNWKAVRGRLILSGIPDPLRQLPNMYALSDVVEAMILEGCKDEKERDDYLRQMYMPSALGDPDAPPPGWSEGIEQRSS